MTKKGERNKHHNFFRKLQNFITFKNITNKKKYLKKLNLTDM